MRYLYVLVIVFLALINFDIIKTYNAKDFISGVLYLIFMMILIPYFVRKSKDINGILEILIYILAAIISIIIIVSIVNRYIL